MKHPPRRCTARRTDGRRCRSWAVRDSDQPLCASHLKASHREASRQPRPTEAGSLGFYDGAYPVEEAIDLLYKPQARNLKGELGLTRLAVRQALLRLKQELDPAEFAQLIALIFKGAHTIADIIRIQRSISGGEDELLQPEIRAALDEMSAEKGYDL